ncbi:hypothetical protein HG530_009908 [Fusarium avenaceum]|nr:hypothetical protein HG530_009908 [Fusarium avenaceum]
MTFKTLLDILHVVFREDDSLAASTSSSDSLFTETTNAQHLPSKRDLAGHGNCRIDRRADVIGKVLLVDNDVDRIRDLESLAGFLRSRASLVRAGLLALSCLFRLLVLLSLLKSRFTLLGQGLLFGKNLFSKLLDDLEGRLSVDLLNLLLEVSHTRLAAGLNHATGEGTDIGSSVTLDLSNIRETTDTESVVLAVQSTGNRLSNTCLTHARRSDKAKNFAFNSTSEFANSDELQNTVLDILKAVMILV